MSAARAYLGLAANRPEQNPQIPLPERIIPQLTMRLAPPPRIRAFISELLIVRMAHYERLVWTWECSGDRRFRAERHFLSIAPSNVCQVYGLARWPAQVKV